MSWFSCPFPFVVWLEDDVVLDRDDGDCDYEEGPLLDSDYYLNVHVVVTGSLVGGNIQPGEDVEVLGVLEKFPCSVVIWFSDEDVRRANGF
jgi:hypothetical protein